MYSLKKLVREIMEKIGSVTMGTSATTITGAIAEHETDISNLNSKSVLINNQVFWNGCTLTVWRNGNIVSARFFGSESAAESNGAKNAYLTVPEGFRPHDYVSIVALDQNGKKMIFQAAPNGNIGIYYLLDPITSPTNIYGALTWAAYN